MEEFLSLPRSARTGLAVLLAVALLGWGIVAYSAKSQHESSQSLQQALATLDSKSEVEKTVQAELGDLQARLAAAETDLSTTANDKAALEDQIDQLKSNLSERDVTVIKLEQRLADLKSGEEDSGETTEALALVGGGQGADVEAATLRQRLTTARTTLSARTATLAQRDRELERTKSDLDAARADIEGFQNDLVEQGVLRERLNKVMTTLSGRTATLAQRDRELEALNEDFDKATATIAELEADLVEQGVLRERLTTTMTKLSGQTAMLGQRDQALAKLNEEHDALLSKLADLESELTEREETNQVVAGIQSKVDQTEQTLNEAASALEVNQQQITDSEARLAELRSETETVTQTIQEKEQLIAEREQDLADLDDKITAEEEKLESLASAIEQRQGEIEEAKSQLAELKAAEAKTEANISSLTAEIDEQQASLSDQEDAIAIADGRLTKLRNEIAAAEGRIQELERLLGQKLSELDERKQEFDAVEASLAALKENREATAGETERLASAVKDQEAVLKNLETAKAELEKTNVELGYQKKILSDRQEQIQEAEDRLQAMQKASQAGTSAPLSLGQMPIAAVGSDNLAILPVDPSYEPFPVQTPIGIRLTQVHFDLGSAELTPGGQRKAREAAAWIREQDVKKIRLLGFTDSIGTKANNLALAERRAQSLLQAFEAEGVDPNRVEIVAKGEVDTREVTEDNTAEPLNRCVGVFISAEG